LNSFNDFLINSDAVEGLCWGYDDFDFGLAEPSLSRTPFWQAFSEFKIEMQCSPLWNNVLKVDNNPVIGKTNPPSELETKMAKLQANLFQDELTILRPDVCIFLSGPYYDKYLKLLIQECNFSRCSDVTERKLARVTRNGLPELPECTYRTYHPKYLRLSNQWHYLAEIRRLAKIEAECA